MTSIMRVIEEIRDSLYTQSTVNSLIKEGCKDYDRGVIKGKIEMVNKILRELEQSNRGSKNETNSIR